MAGGERVTIIWNNVFHIQISVVYHGKYVFGHKTVKHVCHELLFS